MHTLNCVDIAQFVAYLVCMPGVQLKISDLGAVAGYSRFQVHTLLDEVFPDCAGPAKKGRSHRSFRAQDLLVISVLYEIEKKYGVKRNMLALIGPSLRETLNGPRAASREARLLLTFMPPTVTYLAAHAPVNEGIVIPLGPLFSRVDEYLGVSHAAPANTQRALAPAVLKAARRSAAARSR